MQTQLDDAYTRHQAELIEERERLQVGAPHHRVCSD